MMKVDLHTHSADDPSDRIAYTTHELIDRAAERGFDALALTLHDKQLDTAPYRAFAAARGIVLVPGIERTIEGRHVLLLNYSRASESVDSFADLARLKQHERGLVIAPHPFFPARSALRGCLTKHAGLFDAVEWNAMFMPYVNFNAFAERWAHRHRKPMVGNGDVHRLEQLGTTYSLVDAERVRSRAVLVANLPGHHPRALTSSAYRHVPRTRVEHRVRRKYCSLSRVVRMNAMVDRE